MAAPRSNRPRSRRFDDDGWQPDVPTDARRDRRDVPDDPFDEPNWSTYPSATKGPQPVPEWVVRDPKAVDDDLGVMKTGKEADVSLLRRVAVDTGQTCLLAVKRYRSAEHRMFHRDAGYLEGRRLKKSRETRAVATRTAFGKEIIAGQWALAEFAVLGRLWSAGAGYAHGDLSAYNVLVHDGRLVLIDLPQAVDVVANPRGFEYLRRDCDNICTWFESRGVAVADVHDLFDDLARRIAAR
jgi:RIO kinase 1